MKNALNTGGGQARPSRHIAPGLTAYSLLVVIAAAPDWWPWDTLPDLVNGTGIADYLTPAAIAIACLVAVAVLYTAVKRFRETRADQFQSVLADHDEVTVLMHPNPDPDAMASAMGVEAIAESVDTHAHIQYTGQIRHQENRAFRTVLEFDCEAIENASELATRDAVVLVDHNTPRGFTDAEKIEPIAVIDHHPGNGTGTAFTDVRDTYGAAATILTEYLHDLGAFFETDEEDTARKDEDDIIVTSELSTGLLYGVYSDTSDLTRGCIQPDFDACSQLFPTIDTDLLNRIANPEVSHDVLKVKADAITNIQIEGSFGVCNVGAIDNVDSLSQAVDELMRIEGVTAAVVYGRRNGTLHLSGRSHDDRVHIGECLQHAVSDMELASAGGHARMGGGQIPVTQMNDIGSSEGTAYDEFNEILFAALNGDY